MTLHKSWLLSILIAVSVVFPHAFGLRAAAQEVEAPEADSGIYKREYQATDWLKQVPGVDYSKDKDIKLKYGDVLATKESPLVFHFGTYQLVISPYSVFRIHGVQGEETEAAVPELLFGEALFVGRDGFLLLPGQNLQSKGRAYIYVDEDKYSMTASFEGGLMVLPVGTDQPIELTPGDMLELGPDGETGDPTGLSQDEIDQYMAEEVPEDAPKVSILGKQQALTLEKLNEYWSKERLILLQPGPESEAGLAIASGEDREEDSTSNVTSPVFDPNQGSTQTTLTFSHTVNVTEDGQAPTEGPEITSIAVAGKTVTLGDIVSLKHSDLTEEAFVISGRTSSDNPEEWILYIKVNDEETQLDKVLTFDHEVKVSQDFPAAPSVYSVMLGDFAAETFSEDSVLTREHLESGRLKITGSAAAGQNILMYPVQVIARKIVSDDEEEVESVIAEFQVEVDLTELNRVEVSIDNGIGWETADDKEDWSYSMSPMDGETYNVKVRAYDVMENVSDEQFEPYTFTYSYKTDTENLRETFEEMMVAFVDEDRVTFLRNTSEDFASNIEDLRDVNELESSVSERFACCTVNINYTISAVDANRDSRRGSVEFSWVDKSGMVSESNYAIFNYVFEDGAWKFVEVVDPNTFLRTSRIAYLIELSIDKTTMTADGEETATLSAHVLDNAGSIVGNGVEVYFTADDGTLSPAVVETYDGNANTTYIAGTTEGVFTITATSGNASDQVSVTVNPISPPLPPDQEE